MVGERPPYPFRIAEPMVGDVNLFFNDHYDRGVAEAEIMIAGVSARSFHSHGALESEEISARLRQPESRAMAYFIYFAEGEYRGKGYGREAMVLMLQYGTYLGQGLNGCHKLP
jgi:hypothetical protein